MLLLHEMGHLRATYFRRFQPHTRFYFTHIMRKARLKEFSVSVNKWSTRIM